MKTNIKILLAVVVIIFVALLFRGRLILFQSNNTVAPANINKDDALLEKIKKLPLEKRIGQLMIFGFAAKTPDDHVKRLIAEYGIGGVNLLKRNVENAEQIKHLAASLQELTSEAGLPPILIAVDQEGGDVLRFSFLS